MQVYESNGYRFLRDGNVFQGVIRIGDEAVISPFIKIAVDAINSLPLNSKVLVLGGGTYTIPSHARADIRLTVIEIDPNVESLAIESFGWVPTVNVATIVGDAETYVPEGAYGLVVVDLHDGRSVPAFVRDKAYYSRLADITDHVIVNELYGGDESLEPLYDYSLWPGDIRRVKLATGWSVVILNK